MPNSALRGIALANLKPQKCYPGWLGLAPHPSPLGVSGLRDPQVHASLKWDLMEVGFPERRGAPPPPHSPLCCLHLAPEPSCWLCVLQRTCSHGTCWEEHEEGEWWALRRAHITSSYLEDDCLGRLSPEDTNDLERRRGAWMMPQVPSAKRRRQETQTNIQKGFRLGNQATLET